MSQTIDNRTVQLEFDNRDFKAKVADTIKDLTNLNNMLKLKDAVQGFANIRAEADKVKFGGIEDALQQLNGHFDMFGIFALNVLNRISNAIIDMGQKMVDFAVMKPIREGFGEYELEIGSVQTIMNSTSKSAAEVYGYLDELNTYADKTIYSFSDMTASIGKFTNSGVKLDDAVAAIQGVANEAAHAGAGTNEASRAMYNFAQALSAGSVKLIDWKSIENANMATVDFKEQLIQTAVALGTVKKTEEGYISTTKDAKGSVSETFTATSKFNDSLSAQWMTTDVLVETLSHYSTDVRDMSKEEVKAYKEKLKSMGFTKQQIKDIIQLGKDATDSAQKVRKFSQLVDTVGEALASGWTKSFKIIFGDITEATELWTNVNNVVSGFVDATSDYRNTMLQTWHDLGGRTMLIKGLGEAFEFLGKNLAPIGQAFDEAFGKSPQQLGYALMDLTQKFYTFVHSLQVDENFTRGLHDIFSALFTAAKNVGTVLGGAGKAILSVLGPLVNLVKDIGATAGGVIGTFFGDLASTGDVAGFIAEKLEAAGTAIGNFINGVDSGIPKISDFDGALDSIRQKLEWVAEHTKEAIKGVFGGILDVINDVSPKISEFFNSLGFDDIFAVINAGALAGMAAGLIELGKSVKEFLGNTEMASLASWGETFGALRETLETFQTTLKAEALKSIAIAVALLVGSVLLLSFVDPVNTLKGVAAIGALMFMLAAAIKVMVPVLKDAGEVAALAPTLVAFGAAILILTAAVAILGHIDAGALVQGVAAVGVALAMLVGSIMALADVGPKIMAVGAAMIGISAALLIMSGAIAILSLIPAENLEKAMVAMGAGLLAMGIALDVMKSSIPGAVALSIAAAGILLLTPALVALSLIPMENIVNALVLLGGALLVIGLAAAIFEPVIVPMMGLGIAIALIGAGCALAGAGLLALATAFNLIAISGAGAAYAVTNILTAIVDGLATTIPTIAAKFAEGMTTFLETLAANAGRLGAAFKELLIQMLDGVGEVVPKIIEVAWKIIDAFVLSITENVPMLVQSGIDMINSILQGLTEGLPAIIDNAFQMAIAFVNGLADAIRENHEAVYEAAKNLFEAIIEALAETALHIVDDIANLGADIMSGIGDWWNGIFNASKGTGEAIDKGIAEGSSDTKDTVKDAMDGAVSGVEDSASAMSGAAGTVSESLTSGINVDPVTGEIVNPVQKGVAGVQGLAGSAGSAGKTVGTNLSNGVDTGASSAKSKLVSRTQAAVTAAGSVPSKSSGSDVGGAFGSGMYNGMGAWIGPIGDRAAEMVRNAKERAKAEEHSASPSKDTMQYGEWFGEGFYLGIGNTMNKVGDTAADMVKSAKDPVSKSMTGINDILSSLDFVEDQPVIRPVLDASSVYSGMDQISRVLGREQTIGLGYISSKVGMQQTAAPTALRSEAQGNVYNFNLQYDAGADANQLVRDMTVAVRQSAML